MTEKKKELIIADFSGLKSELQKKILDILIVSEVNYQIKEKAGLW